MRTVLEFEHDELPTMLNVMIRTNFWKRRKESYKWQSVIKGHICRSTVDKNLLPLQKCKLTFIRYSSREPDYDGLIASFKLVCDAIVKSGIILDDTYGITGIWDVSWRRCKPKQGKIYCKVEAYD